MTTRDERLAAKYAAKGMRSATETARAKEAAKTGVTEDPMEGMRRALRQPRTQESIDNAHRHKRGLPRLGGGS